MILLKTFFIILIYSSQLAFGNNFEGVLSYKMTTTPRVNEERFQNLRVTYKGHFRRIDFEQLSKKGKENHVIILDFKQNMLKVAFEGEKSYFYYRIDDPNSPKFPPVLSLSNKAIKEKIGAKDFLAYTGKITVSNKPLDFKAWYHTFVKVDDMNRYVPQLMAVAPELDFLNYMIAPQMKTILIKSQFQNPDGSSSVINLSRVESKVVDQAIFYLDKKFLKEAKSLNLK